MPPKPLTDSKTFWFALVTIVVGIAGVAPEIAKIVQENPLNTSDWVAFTVSLLTVVVGVGNVVLRVMTNQPVKL
jgi:hypothetical protein